MEKELERLQKLDIIEQVNSLTSWMNPFVALPKEDNKTRIPLDTR